MTKTIPMNTRPTLVKFGSGIRRDLNEKMANAESFSDWKSAAIKHDQMTGMDTWREVDQTRLFDHVSIRGRLEKLRKLRRDNDDHALLFALNEGIHGNMGGMGKAELHTRAKFGTKVLIEDYVNEISDALRHIETVDESVISFEEKQDFYNRASHCYGRSALMLSGGGALGFFHAGVIKALLEQGLLPTVISGASAGSLISGVLGTHTDEELESVLSSENLLIESRKESDWFKRMVWGRHVQIDVQDLEKLIARLIPDMTFQEAFKKTGRNINISVAPAELHQTSRLLNAVASPNVYIRSAVKASCAVPGVYPAVTLSAKNVDGRAQPYLPSRTWVDGSISDDLPAKRLARMYGVNHFIVSQINPLVLPWAGRTPGEAGLIGMAAQVGTSAARYALTSGIAMTRKYAPRYPRLNMFMNSMHSLVDQDYNGDINIVPSFRFFDLRKILAHLDEEDLMFLIREGERAAWSKVSAIDNCTKISRELDSILARMDDQTPSKIA